MSDKKFYETVCKTQEYKNKVKQLQTKIDKAIEVLKLCNSKCSKEVIQILKGEEDVKDNKKERI